MSLTAEDVRNVEFSNAPVGRRGYAKHEVDDFMVRIAKTLSKEDDVSAAEVHHVQFGRPLIGRRGYDEREVDDFLDQIEEMMIDEAGLRPHAYRVPAARDRSPESSAEPVRDAG
ncbi:cell division protein DivIVA [Prauserella marina]|uniref:Cell wall synthesis protein Wag31 n=1 Tax=Prauserella marina TaxID=530584 RepID=A0A222VWG9_9PSEU|nr:DivIVA domain-containing protein [Prauserella marina]ASR38053.1 cell division protein DivIVA [Prauserella marina]PWV73294.1 DivIVA domain-containing protein [Prauserella marina]SDD67054.1 DivIVA domain-containing protein [Prauserella marina]